jgi:hypothetical protein
MMTDVFAPNNLHIAAIGGGLSDFRWKVCTNLLFRMDEVFDSPQ